MGYLNLNGFAKPISGPDFRRPAVSSKCPLAKMTASVTKNAYDGLGGGSTAWYIENLQDVAETNWKPEHVAQQVQTFYNHKFILTGPWAPGDTIATALPVAKNKLAKAMDFTVMLEGNYLAITTVHYGTTYWLSDIRVWIDDEEIVDWYLGTRAAGVLQGKSAIKPDSFGPSNNVINLNFAERGIYKVRVSGVLATLGGTDAGSAASGMIAATNPNTRLFKPAPRANIGVISDSWFDTVGTNTTLNPSVELSHQLNANVWNYSQGGSGFCNPSGAGLYGDRSYPSDLVWDAVHRGPTLDLMIINGSANDLGYTDIQVTDAMKATFDRVREFDPELPIVWVGLEPVHHFESYYTIATMKAREILQKNVAEEDPNVVLTILPCGEDWITGTGKTTAVANDGNQDFVIGPDGIHLSAYGTKFIGRMIGERMKTSLTRG